jgi:hypothetical protein
MRHNSRRTNKGGKSGYQGNNNNKKPSRTRVFDSNGPDARIRGTAWQVTEKYQALAKDAEASGNWVMAESYYQHAEHYQRIINEFEDAQALYADKPQAQQQPKKQNDDVETKPTKPRAKKAKEQESEMAVA